MKTSVIGGVVLNALLATAGCPFMDAEAADRLERRGTFPVNHTEKAAGTKFLDQFTVNDTDSYSTTDFGTPVDDHTSLKAGDRGPTLLEDFVLRTRITRFDHERIPERVVHARGAAAHGYFESYADWSNITAASFLGAAGKQTPIFLRFSTVAGSRGSIDSARDVHGFSLRFYTDEGNYDIVGNNIPIFFIQDAMNFPDLIHAVKPNPQNEIPQAQTAHDSAWDYFGSNPSTLHTLFWALSGHGIPRSFRHMDGFGIHTFRFVNDEGKSKLVKFHFKTQQGLASLTWPEAQGLGGQNPDWHRQDLFESIDSGAYPEWEVSVQIMEEEDVLKYGVDLLDPTKIVPVEYVPLTPLGKFVLTENPRNYFAETEQAMFCPGHVVRGIDFSDDPLLQGRLFSYVDTQLSRNMGSPNFEQIPINRPRVPVHNNNRDGAGQQMIPLNNAPYYVNTLNNNWPKPANQTQGNGFFTAPARRIVDAAYVRETSPTFSDYWTQPRLFYNSLLPAEQQMVVNAARFELSKVASPVVKQNAIAQFNKIDHDLAERVAVALGMEAPAADPQYYHNNKTAGVSVFAEPLPSVAGLQVGILATDSSNSSLSQASALAKSFKQMGAVPVIISETLAHGADATYIASDAVLFDGVIVVDGTQSLFTAGASTLYPIGRPAQIVRDAFYYGKPIGAVGAAKDGLSQASVPIQKGVFTANSTSKDFVNDFEGGLKQFKYLDRFPLDS
ncbi:catalase-domain-containing protein [Xylona heveae TC161]|uniref:Catalase n=1 Tax=Xylona heveae (strain CBS 132557 / TC161) TaxID=1328760 RepID=A0A164ZCJ1_XYLHT|nr:catalase-domain-containing protein [Xylona heveae TC161]KZF18935.1 catalase-domain-containing protein [Xylona heveae TC161]